VADDAARAFADGGKLAVCVGALVSNAAKFCGDGLIAVTAERTETLTGDRLTISVSDTGMGIATGDLARIFEPFVQLDGGKTRAKDGLGLGLSVAQRMAKTLGGEIAVRSELGRGSTFSVIVPMRADIEVAARARTAA
jgi:signal transduction histidine kinase